MFQIAVIGSTKCGKTSLIHRFVNGHYPENHETSPKNAYQSHNVTVMTENCM